MQKVRTFAQFELLKSLATLAAICLLSWCGSTAFANSGTIDGIYSLQTYARWIPQPGERCSDSGAQFGGTVGDGMCHKPFSYSMKVNGSSILINTHLGPSGPISIRMRITHNLGNGLFQAQEINSNCVVTVEFVGRTAHVNAYQPCNPELSRNGLSKTR